MEFARVSVSSSLSICVSAGTSCSLFLLLLEWKQALQHHAVGLIFSVVSVTWLGIAVFASDSVCVNPFAAERISEPCPQQQRHSIVT